MVVKVSETQKGKYCVISLVCGFKKILKRSYLCDQEMGWAGEESDVDDLRA